MDFDSNCTAAGQRVNTVACTTVACPLCNGSYSKPVYGHYINPESRQPERPRFEVLSDIDPKSLSPEEAAVNRQSLLAFQEHYMIHHPGVPVPAHSPDYSSVQLSTAKQNSVDGSRDQDCKLPPAPSTARAPIFNLNSGLPTHLKRRSDDTAPAGHSSPNKSGRSSLTGTPTRSQTAASGIPQSQRKAATSALNFSDVTPALLQATTNTDFTLFTTQDERTESQAPTAGDTGLGPYMTKELIKEAIDKLTKLGLKPNFPEPGSKVAIETAEVLRKLLDRLSLLPTQGRYKWLVDPLQFMSSTMNPGVVQLMTISKTDIELTSEQYALVGALWEALVASWRTAVLCYESALKQLQQDKPLPDVYGSSQFANLRMLVLNIHEFMTACGKDSDSSDEEPSTGARSSRRVTPGPYPWHLNYEKRVKEVAQELALEKANDLYDPKATQATKPDVTV